MLHKSKSRKAAILKYGLSAPLFAGMLILSSATAEGKKVVKLITPDLDLLLVAPEHSELLEIPKESTLSVTAPGKPRSVSIKIVPLKDSVIKQQMPPELSRFIFNSFSEVHINRLRTDRESELGDGLAFYTFTVKNKKIEEFQLLEGVGNKWENELLDKLNNYTHKVDLPDSRYTIFYGYGDTEELWEQAKKRETLWGGTSDFGIQISFAEDNTRVKGRSFKEPLILIDEKAVSYSVENNLFKLDAKISQDQLLSIKGTKGSKAVEKYGEKGTKGVIEIITKEYAKAHPAKTSPVPPAPAEAKKVQVPVPSKPLSLPKDALYYKDGEEISYEEAIKIKQEVIESMSVWKGKDAVEKFGEKGKSGVIEFTLKK